MSHPCHQCGAEVGEGNPFCRQCGAPQIRVGHGGEEPPAAEPAAAEGSAPGPGSTLPPYDSAKIGINRRLARKQAALAGVLLAIIIVLSSFTPWAFLLIAFPGLLAVQLYYRNGPGQKISAGAGAGIGLLTGLIGFLIFSVPAFPFALWYVVLHPDPELMQQFRAQMEAVARSNPNPQAQQIMQSLLTPGGMVFICIAGFLFLLIFTLVLSAIGGAIGANLSKRR